MFTTWEQVQEWITDNNFAHWIFYKNNPEGRENEKANDKIIDSNAFPSDQADKLAMTRKYIELYNGRVYGIGFKTQNTTVGGTICEARINTSEQPTNGIGFAQPQMPAFDENKLRESIRKEMEAEWDKREYKRLREDLDKERKAFEQEKTSAIGLLTNYLAPIGKALLEKRARVAGVDAEEPVHAARIVPTDEQEDTQEENVETQEEEIFSDQESDKLFTLMRRFKKAEPDYLNLIERVVEMAERGDGAYKMAKTALLQ